MNELAKYVTTCHVINMRYNHNINLRFVCVFLVNYLASWWSMKIYFFLGFFLYSFYLTDFSPFSFFLFLSIYHKVPVISGIIPIWSPYIINLVYKQIRWSGYDLLLITSNLLNIQYVFIMLLLFWLLPKIIFHGGFSL